MAADYWNSTVFMWEHADNASVFKGDRGIPIESSPYHVAEDCDHIC